MATMEDHKLNDEQKAYLKSLVCQRLAEKPENREFIQGFVNMRNPNLSEALKKGWFRDKEDKLAFYIVKDPKLDVPLLFFSLKCGELTTPFDLERKKEILRNAEMLYAAATGHKSEDWAKDVIDKMKAKGLSDDKIEEEFRNRYEGNLALLSFYDREKLEEGQNIVRVQETYAAVELVHFCVFDPIGNVEFPEHWSEEQKEQYILKRNAVLRKWKTMGMDNQSVGKTLFWHCVVPVIQNIRKVVGCEYLYLFAADRNRYGSLVRYYERLGFELGDNFYVNKAEYDYTCYFMCQPVTSLRTRRNEFFRAYNKPKKTEEPAKV